MRGALVLGLLLVACGPSAPPPAAEAVASEGDEAPPPPRTVEPLREALRVVTEPTAGPLVNVRVAFDAGSADDPPGREGLTHLTATLMAEGGTRALTYGELQQALYPMAARLGVQVGRDQTVFIGQVHRDHAEAFLGLFRDVLVRPRMGEDAFERVRSQARTSLSLGLLRADDEELGKAALHLLLFADHPYRHPVLGTEAGLDALRVDDVRAHRDRVFCAGRATLGVAGPVDEALRRELARSLEVLRSDACRGRQGLPEVAPVDGRRVLIVDKPEAQAVAVSMGLPVEVGRDHPDYPALWLAAAWLGQHRQFVGRLMQGIRAERGLNYGDYAYAEHFVQEGWTRFPRVNDPRRRQHFSIWLRPLAPEHAHFAIRFAVRELERLVEDGLTQDQLDTIRGFASRYVALYLQTPGRRLGTVMDDRAYGIEGGAGYAERLRAAWADLAVEDLNAAVRRHWDPARLRIAVVHPDAEAFAEALASDAPSPITYRSEVSDEVRAEDAHVVGHPLGIDPAAILVTPVDTLVAE